MLNVKKVHLKWDNIFESTQSMDLKTLLNCYNTEQNIYINSENLIQ